MAAGTDPIFVQTPNVVGVSFVNADGTTAQDLVEAGTDGTKVFSASAINTDTVDNIIDVWLHDGTDAFLVGSVSVPAGAGTDGGATPAVNLFQAADMPWLDSDGEVFLPNGWKVQAAPQTAVVASYEIAIVCFAGNY